MRIVLVTGKGGVGKTTVSAATALAASERGHRTIVASTDPAHSLGDAFALTLGDHPTPIGENLWAQQIDTQQQLERYWSSIRDQLMSVLDWGGVAGIEAEEFLVLPGMDELFALLEVNRAARSGDFDAVVVDCAPTAETLRLLSLPEILSWYFERVLPTERRLVRAARPFLSRLTDLPIPDEEVFSSVEGVFQAINQVRELLANTEITSARLVVNPEKMVIDEARRTYTYLGMFGYGVDGVVVNRVLPDVVADPYFTTWRKIQKNHLDAINSAFEEVPRLTLRLFDQEMVGTDRLRDLASELYGDADPINGFTATNPFSLTESDDGVTLSIKVPFAQKGEVAAVRKGNELYLTVGQYHRAVMLPDSLRQRQVTRARLSDGKLVVDFGAGPARRRKKS